MDALRTYVTKDSKVYRIELCDLQLSYEFFKGRENWEVTHMTALF
jgi:hypothetical protein